MARGGDRGGRRPIGSTLPKHMKRVSLHDFRLPQWLVDWLKSHPRQGGRMIEKALLSMYGEEINLLNEERK